MSPPTLLSALVFSPTMNDDLLIKQIQEAADILRSAEALVITAGAGMGVDSGLPDFRGNEGFWKAYPPFQRLGLNFYDLADPEWFERDPRLAWGFYGHRLNLYRSTHPHWGFGFLKSCMERCPMKGFVFTSNVDGQFQIAGFPSDGIVECHGSIHRLQRCDESSGRIWSAENVLVKIDEATMRVIGTLPSDPASKALARPNILMFNDAFWNPSETEQQHQRFSQWLSSVRGARLAVVEMGAGNAIPTVRRQSEQLISTHNARLIRINPRDPNVPKGHVSLPLGALAGLQKIAQILMPSQA